MNLKKKMERNYLQERKKYLNRKLITKKKRRKEKTKEGIPSQEITPAPR